jgi:hypothetical protein
MDIYVELPPQVQFASEDIACTGVQGTDSDEVKCEVIDTFRGEYIGNSVQMLKITESCQYISGNPGTMAFNITSIRNPIESIVSDSFKIYTFTSDGYVLDELLAGAVVNFFCQYPCKTCARTDVNFCLTCYASATERIFHNNQCIDECPVGQVNDGMNSCTNC